MVWNIEEYREHIRIVNLCRYHKLNIPSIFMGNSPYSNVTKEDKSLTKAQAKDIVDGYILENI